MEKKSAATYLWNIIRKYNVDVNENFLKVEGNRCRFFSFFSPKRELLSKIFCIFATY